MNHSNTIGPFEYFGAYFLTEASQCGPMNLRSACLRYKQNVYNCLVEIVQEMETYQSTFFQNQMQKKQQNTVVLFYHSTRKKTIRKKLELNVYYYSLFGFSTVAIGHYRRRFQSWFSHSCNRNFMQNALSFPFYFITVLYFQQFQFFIFIVWIRK